MNCMRLFLVQVKLALFLLVGGAGSVGGGRRGGHEDSAGHAPKVCRSPVIDGQVLTRQKTGEGKNLDLCFSVIYGMFCSLFSIPEL